MIPVTSCGAPGSQRGKGDVTRCTRSLAGLLSLFVIATGRPRPLPAQQPAPFASPDVQPRRLRVRVVDTTGKAVQGATLYVTALHIGAETNNVGIATPELSAPGRLVVRVHSIGYKTSADTLEFVPARGVSMTAVLVSEVTDLASIHCCDRLDDDYGRRPWGLPERLASPPEPAPLAVRARPVSLVAPVTVADTAPKPGAARARDATDRPVQFGIMLGLEHFTQSLSRGDNSIGLAVDALLQAPLPPRRLAIRGDFMYHGYAEGGCLASLPARCTVSPFPELLSIGASLVARMNDPRTRWSPYVLAGIELYAGTQGREAPTPAGLQAGVGFEIQLMRRATVAAEWRAMTVATTRIMPVTFGMRF